MARLLRSCLPLFAIAIAHAALPFAHEGSDLKPDPAARFGTLSNGVRYVVRPHAEPSGRAALRLLVLVGSTMETNRQRGLAHLLEHLSMDGTTHFPPGTYLEHFQRLGMAIGDDTNAFTTSDHTIYNLNVSNTETATLADALQALADCAGGMSLLPDQIEKERGIVLREKRDRDSVERRQWVAESSFVLGAAAFAPHDESGTVEALTRMQRSDFVDFYDTWYRPERMVVIAVGDFDPTAVEQQIAAAFASLAPRAPAKPVPNLGPIKPASALRVLFYPDAEAPAATVAISTITPFVPEPDTLASRREWARRELAMALLSVRLQLLALRPGVPFSGPEVNSDRKLSLYREATIRVQCQPLQWAAAIAAIEQELRRALDHGFSRAEFDQTIAIMKGELDKRATIASHRFSWDIADDIAQAMLDQRVFISPDQDSSIFQSVLADATPEQSLVTLRQVWNPRPQYVKVMGDVHIAGDPTAAITEVFRQSTLVPVTAPADAGSSTFDYTDFGAPGKVRRRTTVDDLDITLVEFANGVRLNLKRWNAAPGRMVLRVRVGTGQLTEPQDQPGLSEVARFGFLAGGLGRHDFHQLIQLSGGREISYGFRVSSDALLFDSVPTPNSLLDQLRGYTAFLVDPGFRPEGLEEAHRRIDETYDRLEHELGGPLQLEMNRLLAGGDPRFGLPPRERMLGYSFDQVKAWLAPQLAKGAIEVGIVGDVDIDAAIDAVGKTLGALPPRDPRPALTKEREVSYPAPFAKEYRVDVRSPSALVALFWPTADASDIRRTRRLDLLADIFAERLRIKVREELSATYAASAGNESDHTFTTGYFFASITVDPPQVARVASLIATLADDLQKNGVTEDEFIRAKRPLASRLRDRMRTNEYWLGEVVSRAQEKPEVLDWWRTCLDDVEAITKADIDELARVYLASSRASRAIVLPASR